MAAKVDYSQDSKFRGANSEKLIVPRGGTVIIHDLAVFKNVVYLEDPATGARGTVILMQDGEVLVMNDDTIIVLEDMTITDYKVYDNIIIYAGNELTIQNSDFQLLVVDRNKRIRSSQIFDEVILYPNHDLLVDP